MVIQSQKLRFGVKMFLNVLFAIIFSDKINIQIMKMKRTANLK